jgi:dynein heavy chain
MYFRNCNKAEKHFDEQTGPVIEKLKAMVVQFKEAMPIVTALRNDKLEPNHWAEIKTLISKDFETENPEFTLKTLIDMDVNQFAEEIAVISTQATQEHNLRGQVAKIADCWRSTAFNTKLDEKTDVKILSDMDDVFTALDDTLAEINMILGSRFVKPLRALAEGWKKDIIYMSEMVDEWLKCQKTWRYLQNIFKGEDIKRTLPEEAKRFEEVDKFFK